MVKITIEDIVFFIFIAIIVGTSLWLMSGSPSEINAIISIGIAVAGSELMLWKYVFKIDKNTTIGFVKVKHDMEKIRIDMNQGFKNINNKLDKLIKR